jgi:hypothetical protein
VTESDLFQLWGARDDRRLSPKPVSVRLPVHVQARLFALEEMYPTKSRTDLITDLLKAGLEVFEKSMPPIGYEIETHIDPDEPDRAFKIPSGIAHDYQAKANKQFKRLEAELGNNKAAQLFDTSAKPVR